MTERSFGDILSIRKEVDTMTYESEICESEKFRLKAEERGYSLLATSPGGRYFNFVDKSTGIGLEVFPKTDEFNLYYNLDLATAIKGCKCGSFMNDNHFKKQEARIYKYVKIIQDAIPNKY